MVHMHERSQLLSLKSAIAESTGMFTKTTVAAQNEYAEGPSQYRDTPNENVFQLRWRGPAVYAVPILHMRTLNL